MTPGKEKRDIQVKSEVKVKSIQPSQEKMSEKYYAHARTKTSHIIDGNIPDK